MRTAPSSTIGLVAGLFFASAALTQERYLNLTWVDRSGGLIEVIGEPDEYRGLDVSPDGRRVAVHEHSGSGGDILLFDADGEGTRLITDASGVQDNAHPIWSPDGSKIVYSSLRDGVWELYVKAVDGRQEEELVHTTGRRAVPMSWSPDGRFVIYWENTGFEWVLPLEGERTPFRLMEGQSSHSQISPDGSWVAYSAGGDIWVRAFPDGPEAWPASTNGGFFPRWRGDGRELYYQSSVSLGAIMAAEVRTTQDSIEVSESRVLFDTDYFNFNHPGNYHTFDVSPNGQRFLIPRPEPDTLIVVDREGDASTTLDTDLYSAPTFSPDGSRIAALRGNRSVRVLDVASGEGRQVAVVDAPRAFARSLVWSPDGERIAYLTLDLGSGNDAFYLADADGDGEPTLIATVPGIAGELIGFTADGRSLLYFSSQLGGDVFFRLPLGGDAELVEIARSATGMRGPRLSADGRYLAYHTEALGSKDVWIRSFDRETGELGSPARVDEGLGMAAWRAGGRELYYVGSNRELMAVAVQTSPALAIAAPRRLFDVPESIPVSAQFDSVGNVSLDGGNVVFAVPPRIPPRPLIEMRVVDRAGQAVEMPGEPGTFFGRPMISPDGTKIAAGKADPEADVFELWVFDLESDTSWPLVSDSDLNSWIWSEDGEELVYVLMDFQDEAGGAIYRRAADGSGSPQLLYRHYPGTSFNLIDWSADGRFVLFNSGGVLYVLALDRSGEPVELIREAYFVGQALLSPDSRYLLYSSDETGTFEPWLRSFDPDAIALGPESDKRQLSMDGSGGPHSWGRNGREISYRNNGAIYTVEIMTSPELTTGAPMALFRHPEGAGNASASRNGERWVFFAPAVRER
jgi:Tol biopolymer transport system component